MSATAPRSVRWGKCLCISDLVAASAASRGRVFAALAPCPRIRRTRALPLQATQWHYVTAMRLPCCLNSVESAAVCIGRCIA
ncbi:hypothetical protein XANMN_11375 [Xanthomonas phaseoli pv. manihotis str. CIO151]|nr:hypothetical protein XANMN_11375 [Xanthomonas phaseoli pv. manihotis str. CIO151]